MEKDIILHGDALTILATLPNESIDCVVTSPPYWALRDYGVDGQIGNESTFGEYIDNLLAIFDEVKRVLKQEGTCWVNLGDTYGTGSGSGVRTNKQATNRSMRYNKKWQERGKASVRGMEKSLLQIPSRFAIEMTDRGWILRNEIIWYKPNSMPQSVKDRFTVDFEKIFFFSKSRNYYFETQFESAAYDGRKDTKYKGGVKDMAGGAHERWPHRMQDNTPARNKRCVWNVPTKPSKGAHFATYPTALIEPMIKAGCPELVYENGVPQKGIVLDPFMGSGTTAFVARELGRSYIGIELNLEYIKLAEKRLSQKVLQFAS